MKISYQGVVLAESDQTIVIEGNHYFPPESVKMEYFSNSDTYTVCPWKGNASYYNVNVGGKEIRDAAWYYPQPNAAAKQITGYVAFYTNKVNVE